VPPGNQLARRPSEVAVQPGKSKLDSWRKQAISLIEGF
jgi:hypothetical protein